MEIEQSQKNIATIVELSGRLKLEEAKLVGYIKDKFKTLVGSNDIIIENPKKI